MQHHPPLRNSSKTAQPVKPSAGSPGERATTAARLANLMAPTLILLVPLLGFLSYHDYEFWRPESLLAAAPFIAIGLTISALIALRPDLLRPASIALLLVLFLDIQFRSTEGPWIAPLMSWEIVSQHPAAFFIGGVLVLVNVLMTVCWLLRRHLGTIVSSIFGVMALAAVLLPSETIPKGEAYSRDRAAKADLPPVVHVVLDGQIGIEGLPQDIPGGAELRRELKAFYDRYGFTVFGGAFSHYTATYESVSNLVNGQALSLTGAHIATSEAIIPVRGIRLRQNAWFRTLSDQGYRIRVYQTDYLDFCSPEKANVDYCFVVPANSIRSLQETELTTFTKATVILNTYLSGSIIFKIFLRMAKSSAGRTALWEKPPPWIWQNQRLGAISAAAVLDRMVDDLRDGPRGKAYFLHLLIPHSAYVLDSDCRLRRDIHTWLGPTDPDVKKPYQNTPESRDARYGKYFHQVRCVHRKLATLFDTMDSAGVLDNATIIVHGDHGSRIPLSKMDGAFSAQFSDTDMIDSYSALFAVRTPGLAAGYDRSLRSIQALFAEIVLKRPFAVETRDVFFRTKKGRDMGKRFIRVPMPPMGSFDRAGQ